MKKPHARAPTKLKMTWRLVRVERGHDPIPIGEFTSKALAQNYVALMIARDCGEKALKLPAWGARNGEPELIYGRDQRSWWFRVETVHVEVDAVH